MERTLVAVKPHAMDMPYNDIIRDLEIGIHENDNFRNQVTKTHARYIPSVPKEVWRKIYAENLKKFDHFEELLETDFDNQPSFVSVYKGEGIVKIVRNLAGPTQVLDNPKDTIRGKYGRLLLDKKGVARLSNGEEIYRNVIHATDETPGEFEREFNTFKPYLI